MSNGASLVPLLLGCILTVTGVHASCPIELSPPSVVVRYGDTVSVNCSTSETQFRGMGWEAPQGGVGPEPTNHLTWTVESLTYWKISPLCYINRISNGTSKQCSRSPEITLYTFPENLTLSSAVRDDWTEGVLQELKCLVPNAAPSRNVTVEWYRGDSLTAVQTYEYPNKEPLNVMSRYMFTPKRQDNGVAIRCEAHLDLRPRGPKLHASSEEFIVDVHYGPDVVCGDFISEGETLQNHCSVEGNPAPVITWKKDGQVKNPSAPLSRGDAGKYTIEAKGFSSITKEITVLVAYGPELDCPSSYTVIEYTHSVINCTVDGFPDPDTTWYKDGEEVEPPEILTRRDTGQYTIIANNSLSVANVTVEIIVEYHPNYIDELEDTEVEVGSSAWLKCSSAANPRPTYSWTYYQAANVVEENEDGVSRLVIHNVTLYNAGYYTCIAANYIGYSRKTVRVTVNGADQGCPIEITPSAMVLPFGGVSQAALCRPTAAAAQHLKHIYWLDQHGVRTDNDSWSPDTRDAGDHRPRCTATFWGLGSCNKSLDLLLYKTPDSMSIRPVRGLGSASEGEQVQLRCDIVGVTPAQNVSVRWYHGNDTLEPTVTGPLRLTDCWPEDSPLCAVADLRRPLNVTSTVSVALARRHGEADFRCAVHLDLGPDGPQLSPLVSDPLNVTVHYKPVINTTKLPNTVPVFRGYPEELVCEAEGHPPPKIQWLYGPGKVPRLTNTTLIVYEAGFYNCTASNEVDSSFHVVEVILKEDYLPLIAGFVAVTVIAISVVFCFIYSIYYKNTKMRRYSFKNPKLGNHDGNVAHNGLDLQFPMSKLY